MASEYTVRDAIRRKGVVAAEGGEMKTKQAAAEEADVNAIMAKWLVHRGPLPGTGRQPMYGDFTGMTDYHQAVERIRSVSDEFSRLPAAVRDRCRNDPGEFLAICFSPERTEEFEQLKALGLAEHELPMAVRLTDVQVSELAQKLKEATDAKETEKPG